MSMAVTRHLIKGETDTKRMSFVRLCLKDVDTGCLILETSWTLFEKVVG